MPNRRKKNEGQGLGDRALAGFNDLMSKANDVQRRYDNAQPSARRDALASVDRMPESDGIPQTFHNAHLQAMRGGAPLPNRPDPRSRQEQVDSQRDFVKSGLDRGAIDPDEVVNGIPTFDNNSIRRREQDGRMPNFRQIEQSERDQRANLSDSELLRQDMTRHGLPTAAALTGARQQGRTTQAQQTNAQANMTNAGANVTDAGSRRIAAEDSRARNPAIIEGQELANAGQRLHNIAAQMNLELGPGLMEPLRGVQSQTAARAGRGSVMGGEGAVEDFETLNKTFGDVAGQISRSLGVPMEDLQQDWMQWYNTSVADRVPGVVDASQASAADIQTAFQIYAADRLASASARSNRPSLGDFGATVRAGAGTVGQVLNPANYFRDDGFQGFSTRRDNIRSATDAAQNAEFLSDSAASANLDDIGGPVGLFGREAEPDRPTLRTVARGRTNMDRLRQQSLDQQRLQQARAARIRQLQNH